MRTISDLKEWVKPLARFGGYVELAEPWDGIDVHIYIYTSDNKYSITARQETIDNAGNVIKSYLGCIASSRRPLVGEDWTRGRDMADGRLKSKTWLRILEDIVAYEMDTVKSNQISAKLPARPSWVEQEEPIAVNLPEGIGINYPVMNAIKD